MKYYVWYFQVLNELVTFPVKPKTAFKSIAHSVYIEGVIIKSSGPGYFIGEL